MSNRFDFLNTALTYLHVGDFPQQCYERWWEITKGGVDSIRQNRLEWWSCFLAIVSWGLGVADEEKPLFATAPVTPAGTLDEQSLVEQLDTDCHDLVTLTGIQPTMAFGGGRLRGAVIKRLISMMLAYVASVMEDSDQVEQFLEEAIQWVKDRLAAA